MNRVYLCSEGKHWRRYFKEWQKDRSDESGKVKKIQRVDGKHVYHLDNASDSLVGTLNLADGDNYPNIQKLLEIASTSPIGSTEAEQAALNIRRLKTVYRSTVISDREGNLILVKLQSFVEVDVLKVADIFLRNGSRR